MDIFEPWRNAPPARHTLESDSEEEQDPEDVQTSRTTSSIKLRRPAPDVKIQLTSDCPALAGEHLIIANSEAGMAWSQGLDASSLSLDGFLLVDGQKAASLTYFDAPRPTVIAFASAPLTYEAMHKVAECLLQECRPSTITIIDSYSYPSYLSSTSQMPSIRFLATGGQVDIAIQRCEPPNLVQGLTAAVACEADECNIPCLVLLLPSNLSDSTSASVIVHATHKQPVPDSIYDYGGPLPGSENLLESAENRTALSRLGTSLGWTEFGWQMPDFSRVRQKRRGDMQVASQAGFGWWSEAKRVHRQAVAEGGMYT